MFANNQIKHTNRFSMEQTPKGYRNNIHYWNEEVTSKEQTPNGMEETSITAEIEALKETLTGDMMQDMETKDKIHNLEMKLNGTKPTDSHFDCIGCGS